MRAEQKKHMLSLSEWHILSIILQQKEDEQLIGGEIGSRFNDAFLYQRARHTHVSQVLIRLYEQGLVNRWYGVNRDGTPSVRASYVITATGIAAHEKMTQHVIGILEI